MKWVLIIFTVALSDDRSIHKETLGSFDTNKECAEEVVKIKEESHIINPICIKEPAHSQSEGKQDE